MHIAFYKARKGNWQDWAVAAATRSPYSHCELVFSDTWLCFSASPRDGGTRLKYITDLAGGKWDLVPVPVSRYQEGSLLRTARLLVGRPYDWPGAFGVALPLLRQNPEAFFCSEIVVMLLQRHGLLLGINPHKTSPGRLYELTREWVFCRRKLSAENLSSL